MIDPTERQAHEEATDEELRPDGDSVAGDHPDPITLFQPEFDSAGRLVWGSVPLPK